MKVLVTVGSMVEKKFTRLFETIDELCDEGVLQGKEIIAQVGFERYKSKNFETFDMASDADFKELISKADLIITHAGTGTVTSCLKQKKKVIIFPRMIEYDEHYDNHQLELSNLFEKNNFVLCAKNKEQLKQCILSLNQFHPAEFKTNNSYINKIVIDFIEK